MNKAEEEEENYSNSEDEDELKKVKGGHKKPSKQSEYGTPITEGVDKGNKTKVNEILGIPMGNTKLQDLDERPDNDPFIAE
ncbi:hypothetical protein Tco_0293221 [Tanacetum coccineum]